MGLRKIRLIKFRSLVEDDDFKNAKDIIETGKFWCSKLWNLNDPMEGVYKITNTSNISEVFSDKNRYVICSFSSKKALKCPLLWGYYAEGYKGIAIEIECSKKIIDNSEINDGINDCIVQVEYVENTGKISSNSSVPKIISEKLKCWEHEEEYRYLNRSGSGNLFQIGEVKKVYFGNPYGNTVNNEQIYESIYKSEKLKKYKENEKALREYLEKDYNVNIKKVYNDYKDKIIKIKTCTP